MYNKQYIIYFFIPETHIEYKRRLLKYSNAGDNNPKINESTFSEPLNTWYKPPTSAATKNKKAITDV